MIKQLLIPVFLVITSFTFAQSTYTFDKNHSRLSFTAKHFSISHVEGNFKDFDEHILVNSKLGHDYRR